MSDTHPLSKIPGFATAYGCSSNSSPPIVSFAISEIYPLCSTFLYFLGLGLSRKLVALPTTTHMESVPETGYVKIGESAKKSHRNDAGLQGFELLGKVWASNAGEKEEQRRLNRSL